MRSRGKMAAKLVLVDVNRETASRAWPLLLEAVRGAHFIALDLELSGLGDVIGRGRGATTESRYIDACETVKTRAILSLGVACFHWQPPPNNNPSLTHASDDPPPAVPPTDHTSDGRSIELGVSVFNVWLMCQSPYTIDPSSALFLLEHGFDFNKQIARGIPYTPGPMEVQEGDGEREPSLHHLLATILAVGKPLVVHNGWIDLLFLYGNFYSPLPPSLGTLLADISEMFVGGVYDTKAIAQYEMMQEATFLEFLFRKCQRDSEALTSRGSPHFELYQPTLSSSVPSEVVPLCPPHLPSLEEVADITLCDTFARYGFCHKKSCPHSHNVLAVLVQQEHHARIKQMKRKRKRGQKRGVSEETNDDCATPLKQCCSTPVNGGITPQDEGGKSLAKQFASELEAAKTRLATSSENAATDTLSHASSLPPHPPTTASESVSTQLENSSGDCDFLAQKPSYGHRAGFDAFMTGYVFAHFALSQNSHQKPSTTESDDSREFDEAVIAGLSSMRNRLGNRNKSVPLILARSQFDKTSPGHRENCDKIAKLKATFQDSLKT